MQTPKTDSPHSGEMLSRLIFAIVLALALFGLIMVLDASSFYASKKFSSHFFFFNRQLFAVVVGVGIMGIFSGYITLPWIQQAARIAFPISVIMLIAVLLPGIGSSVRGASRWIRFFGIGLQPSEIAKLCFVLYLADFFSRREETIRSFSHTTLPILVVTGALIGLIMLQPNFSFAMVFGILAFFMLYLAGANFGHLLLTGIGGLAAMTLLLYLKNYRIARILAFLEPTKDIHVKNWQATQSLIALGSGGFTGVGLGASNQKYYFLPDAHTDFIYSIIGEEFGLLGALAVFLLFTILFWAGMKVAVRAENGFCHLLAAGISLMIYLNALAHIGVCLHWLPSTGFVLPFISYGRSAMIVNLTAVGILLRIARYHTKPKEEALHGIPTFET